MVVLGPDAEEETLVARLVDWVRRNSGLTQLVGIPTLLLLVDCEMRLVARLDLADAGADMALLAMSAFLTRLIARQPDRHVGDKVIEGFCLLVSVGIWVLCLACLAESNFVADRVPGLVPFLPGLSWGGGGTWLVIASLLLGELATPVLGANQYSSARRR